MLPSNSFSHVHHNTTPQQLNEPKGNVATTYKGKLRTTPKYYTQATRQTSTGLADHRTKHRQTTSAY